MILSFENDIVLIIVIVLAIAIVRHIAIRVCVDLKHCILSVFPVGLYVIKALNVTGTSRSAQKRLAHEFTTESELSQRDCARTISVDILAIMRIYTKNRI